MEEPATYTADPSKSVALLEATGDPLAPIEVGAGIQLMHPLELVRLMSPFVQNATSMGAQAARAVINSDKAYQVGTEFLSTCTQQWQAIEDLRKRAKVPVDDLGKYIQSQCVPSQQLLVTARGLVEQSMLKYRRVVAEREAAIAEETSKRQEADALKLAEQEEKRGNTGVAAAILDAATAPVPVRAPAPIGGAKTNSMGRSTNEAVRWIGTAEAPMTVLKAIIDGVYPISMIEFKEGELNKAAKTVAAVGTFHGLKVAKSESLRQR